MNFEPINIGEIGSAILISVLLLNAHLAIVIVLAGVEEMLIRFNLQIVDAAKRMNHPFEAFLILDDPALLLAESQDVDTKLWNYQEVVGLQEEAFDSRFPELEAFVPVPDEFGFQVEHEHIEGVDADAFVANDHTFTPFAVFVRLHQHIDIAIVDI